LMSLSFTTKAGTFTTQEHGKYSSTTIWKNNYPGNLIRENDTVYINSNIQLSGDIVVKGVLIVNERHSLMGDNNLVVLNNGSFINKGITIVKSVTNRGLVRNNSILETNVDLINTGTLENNQSMIVGNILDNTGIITGSKGNIMANARLVNSAPGKITGTTDICSNDFSNVGGGTVDSVTVSFCGNRIFSSMFLTASVKAEGIQLNLNNCSKANYNEYRIEKSTDGENYTAVAFLRGVDVKNNEGPFIYQDNASVSTSSVFYRMKLIDAKGTERFIPAVEIGSIQNSKYSVSKL
jgi:hypothetical protein